MVNLNHAVVSLPIQDAHKAQSGIAMGIRGSESEGLSSSDFREHNVESLTLHAIGLNWSGEKVSFSWRTGNLRGWLFAATLPWICCARR